MSKEDVLAVFERILLDPWAQRSGNVFEQDALKKAPKIMENDREGLVAVLRDWIHARNQFETLVAMSMAGKLGLWELKDDIRDACANYLEDGFFKRHNVNFAERVLNELGDAEREDGTITHR